VGNDTVLKDREYINLCLKEDDSVSNVSVHLRRTRISDNCLKIEVSINLIILCNEMKTIF